VQPEAIRKALATFSGIHRRFEFALRTENRIVIDDYAHHPEELRAAISAARELYPDRKIAGCFQPHTYTRTRDYYLGFAETLDMLDECFLLPVYAAREKPMPDYESHIIYNNMKNKNKHLMTKEQFLLYMADYQQDVFMMLGAGDIDKMVDAVVKMA
jgi:UDP-N-acetylmuramate--alanine ligase